jgi:hypothetical protein
MRKEKKKFLQCACIVLCCTMLCCQCGSVFYKTTPSTPLPGLVQVLYSSALLVPFREAPRDCVAAVQGSLSQQWPFVCNMVNLQQEDKKAQSRADIAGACPNMLFSRVRVFSAHLGDRLISNTADTRDSAVIDYLDYHVTTPGLAWLPVVYSTPYGGVALESAACPLPLYSVQLCSEL